MTVIDRNTQIELVGRGTLTIRPNDHVATGGEGSVYRVADTIIKLYTDPNKMQREGIADKILLLAPLSSERIIAPRGLVLIKGQPRGFYMSAADGDPLSLFFTNDYRREKKLTDKDASVLADRMREVMATVHAHSVVMGDSNEMNWFALPHGKGGPDPRAIDVDSWSVGKFPVRAVMPSIRDWNHPGFTPLSDWFGWGVVTFQVYTGIHPYKGKLPGYAPGAMQERMKANASVFAPGVGLNRAVRDFSCIPGPLLDWYRATFQQGERTIPPSPFDTGTGIASAARVMRIVTTQATGMLVYEKIFEETNDPAIKIYPCGVVLLRSGKLADIEKKRIIGKATESVCEVIKVEGGYVKTEGKGRGLRYSYIHGNTLREEALGVSVAGEQIVRYADRIFLLTADGLTELIFTLLGKPILSPGMTWGVMSKSVRWYDGVGIQDTMGAMYLILPFGDTSCAHVRVPELDRMRAVNAKAGNRFVSIVAIDKKGDYHKLELSLDKEYRSYSLRIAVADGPDLNLSILPKGVCATVVEDGTLDIFVPSSGVHKEVKDKIIATDMSLASWGDTVVCMQNGAVWSLKLK
ncbi:MAG: hypothetical protein WC878_07925 [Candidatus Paceibacterota bacterium]|jgi:hypothetical protein